MNKYIEFIKPIYKPIVILLIAMAAISFLSKKITSITISIQERRTANIALDRRMTAIGQIDQDLKTLGDDNYNKIDKSLPIPDDILDVISLLDSEADRIGVRTTINIGQLSLGQEIYKGAILGTVDYNMSLSGSISALNRFLQAIYDLPYFVTADNFDVASPSSTSGWSNPGTNASLRGKIYVKQIPR